MVLAGLVIIDMDNIVNTIKSLQSSISQSSDELARLQGQLKALTDQKSELEKQLVEYGVDLDNPSEWIDSRKKLLTDKVDELKIKVEKIQSELSVGN